jgi:class 3 adenylate cyclase
LNAARNEADNAARNERAADRRLTAILAADLVGYSRLMGADEVGTLTRLTQVRRDVIDPAIAGCRGRIVKTTGDGLLLAFGSIVDATRCAILIQHGVAQWNGAAGASEPMQFRIGVNIGDVIIAGDDIFGDCVNIAARLESLAEPGGICISKSAHDQVRGKINVDFVDIGPHQVKNIARPVEVLALPPVAIAAIPAAELALVALAARRPVRMIVASIAALCLLGAAGAGYYFSRDAAVPLLQSRMTALLDRLLPDMPSKVREHAALDYLKLVSHRAFAVAPKAHSRWLTGYWPSRETAIEKVLERCQLNFNEPCAVIAADDELIAPGADGTFATMEMPRVTYRGKFDPDQIPGMRSAVAKRPDVVGYGKVTGPKAAALYIRGVKIITSAMTQRGAEVQALKACNDDPARRKTDGPCFLYAAGNDVVLPQRLNGPLTPR